LVNGTTLQQSIIRSEIKAAIHLTPEDEPVQNNNVTFVQEVPKIKVLGPLDDMDDLYSITHNHYNEEASTNYLSSGTALVIVAWILYKTVRWYRGRKSEHGSKVKAKEETHDQLELQEVTVQPRPFSSKRFTRSQR
jgi:hypothetical protein